MTTQVNNVKSDFNLIRPETSNHTNVGPRDFKNYFNQGYGWCGFISIIILSIFTSALQLLPTFWLSYWLTKDKIEQKKKIYPLIFTGLVLFFTLISFARAMALFKVILTSMSTMLRKVTDRVLRAKIVFFDSNPIGRILTRFTKDVVIFDLIFPLQSLMFINGILRSLTVVITIAVINPYVLIPAAIIGVLMVIILKMGHRLMADASRMDSLEREPVHNTFSMMITGLVSCRV